MNSRFHYEDAKINFRILRGNIGKTMRFHYTFRTYRGKPLLEEPKIRAFLRGVFGEIAKEKGFEILACEILADHVHLLIEQGYSLSESLVMKNLKGISARRLFQEYNTNRFEVRKLWGRSFHSRRVDSNQQERVTKYIVGQRDAEGIDKRSGGCENLFSRAPLKEPRIYSQERR